MGFSPSVEVHDRMVSELAGVFIDRAFNPPPHLWLVAKLPMNLLREIRAGAELSQVQVLLAGVLNRMLNSKSPGHMHRTANRRLRRNEEARLYHWHRLNRLPPRRFEQRT